MSSELRVGMAGLGAASVQILPAFRAIEGARLVAGADVRPEARAPFTKAFGVPAYDTVEALCRAPDIDVIWIATPNTLHCEHTVAAARAGKHVICEKPMAVSLAECDRMIEACQRAGVQLIQGHSKIFDAPIRKMRELVASGRLGAVVQINAWNFNNWLQRPRLPSEIDTALGGGLVYRQGPHHVDIVRYIAGGMATRVRGVVGRRDPNFDTEGNFNALIEFQDGAVANLGFNGYGYFDVTELTWSIGEGGAETAPFWQTPRPRRTGPVAVEAKHSYATTEGPGTGYGERGPRRMPFFGLTVVSCERGAIRQSPDGLYLYTEQGREEVPIGANSEREAELIELIDALKANRTVFPDGNWGRATLEVCLGILESSRTRTDVPLTRQVPNR
jgi:phthalate 4,5-cis-dihydrodiol dehydrogenase